MRMYPAIRAKMGDWSYYIVRMKMREVAQEVRIAQDIYPDRTLSSAIQRTLGERRVRKEIVGYLANRSDRFFSSIVVAALEGDPAWTPVEMDHDAVPEVFSRMAGMNEAFGVLSFGDEPKYYALDGQHRVAAIKLLVSGDADMNPPPGFDKDLLSVIVLVREDHDVSTEEWLRRYRRLFSSLNRYAKPTDRDTNIIMDEDDLFAILTRRLVTDYDFLQAPSTDPNAFRVQTKGKNLKETDEHFTSLQTLYDMTENLLCTHYRSRFGWSDDGSTIDKQIRPSEDAIDRYYEELVAYWDAIRKAIPDLHSIPRSMRTHDSDTRDDETQDHLLFWPIGQILMSKAVRIRLDRYFADQQGRGSVEEMAAALDRLADLPWTLHESPWRHLLLVKLRGATRWRMRSESRKQALDIAERILHWMILDDGLDEDGVQALRSDWEALLYPEPPADESVDEMWSHVSQRRAELAARG